MKRISLGFLALTITMAVAELPSAAAGAPRRVMSRAFATRSHATPSVAVVTTFDSRTTIVPFAVPVAVPVATVAQPTLLYAYSHHAPPSVPWAGGEAEVFDGGPAGTTSSENVRRERMNRSPAEPSPSTGAAAAAAILTRHCARCHSEPEAKGDRPFFDLQGRLHDRLPRHVMLEMVEPDAAGTVRMPPGELPKLTDDELRILRDWAKLPRDAVY